MRKYSLILLLLIMGWSLLRAQDPNREIWSLRECLEYAKAQNLALRIAQLDLQNNEVALTRARAARLPNLNGNTNFQVNFGYTVNPFTNEFTSQGNQSFNLGVNSNVTLYNGGRLSRQVDQAEVDQRVSELDLKQAEYDLALNITLAYLDILRNRELVRMAEVQVNSTQGQRDRSKKLVDAGVIPQADLLQLESQIATDQLALVNARNNLETAFLTLMQLLQLDLGQKFGVKEVELADPEDELDATSVAEIYRQAEQEQPFIQSADLQVRSAALGESIAQTSMMPNITAGGSMGTGWASGRQRRGESMLIRDTSDLSVRLGGEFQTLTVVNEFEQPTFETYRFEDQLRENINASAFLSLNVPIYNRYQNRAAIQQAEIRREQTRLRAQQSRQQLQRDIQTAYVQARSALGTYQATEKQIEALRLTLQNTEKQFNLGVVNSVDYLIAKNNLERAQNDLVQAKYNYLFRRKVLDFYRGQPIGF